MVGERRADSKPRISKLLAYLFYLKKGELMFRKIWEVIIYVCLFIVIFYAGATTGVIYEGRKVLDSQKRLEKLESTVRENVGRITALEAVGRKK